MIDFDKILIRCSAIGKIMTAPQTKADKDAGLLGKTATSYLDELYLELKYNRKKEFESKYITKGLQQEEAGITLYCLEKKKFLTKNDKRLNNEFITGEPDTFDGPQLEGCEEGADIKNSWSVHTFPFFVTKLDPDYYYQNLGYMALTGAKRWRTVYTLCNCTPEQIMAEKRSVWFKMNQPADNDPLFLEKCIEIEKNMIFDMAQFKKDYPGFDIDCKEWRYDIPRSERIREFPVERDENAIQSIYAQVRKCRQHLKTKHGPSTIIAHRDEELPVTVIEQA